METLTVALAVICIFLMVVLFKVARIEATAQRTLGRYRSTISHYERWLAEFDDVSMCLRNIRYESDEQALWFGEYLDISTLRDKMRAIRKELA